MAETSSSLVPARWWQLRRSDSAVLRALGRSLTVQAAVVVLLLLCGAALFTSWLALQNPFASQKPEEQSALVVHEPQRVCFAWHEQVSSARQM